MLNLLPIPRSMTLLVTYFTWGTNFIMQIFAKWGVHITENIGRVTLLLAASFESFSVTNLSVAIEEKQKIFETDGSMESASVHEDLPIRDFTKILSYLDFGSHGNALELHEMPPLPGTRKPFMIKNIFNVNGGRKDR